MRSLIVIPARLASSRLPEKLLLRAGGMSVLAHTHHSASRARCIDRAGPGGGLVVAVDDQRLQAEVESFGGTAIMTSRDCQSGTDRIAEVARRYGEIDLFINVQGDEPEIDPAAIDVVAELMRTCPDASMATVAKPIRDAAVLANPNCVKVVVGGDRQALYFSRAPIPFIRDGLDQAWLDREPPLFWHHVGLYAYRRDFLRWFVEQPPGELEQAEKLEQLRALAAGHRIIVGRVETSAAGVDTRDDFEAFVARVESRP